MTNNVGLSSLDIFAGDGGSLSNGAIGNGGNGGALSTVMVKSMAEIWDDTEIYSGRGGNADAAGNGGNAGDASGINVTDKFGAYSTWFISAGAGALCQGTGGKGGNGGNLKNVTFTGPNSDVGFGFVEAGANNGGTGAGSTGGIGGSIDGIKGSVGTVQIAAQKGGFAEATGGLGGSISNVISRLRILRASSLRAMAAAPTPVAQPDLAVRLTR